MFSYFEQHVHTGMYSTNIFSATMIEDLEICTHHVNTPITQTYKVRAKLVPFKTSYEILVAL
jgi:hypothetical protein